MYKKLFLAAVAAGVLALTGCASDGSSSSSSAAATGGDGGAEVFGTPVYLRGEFNDWAAKDQYLLKKVSDGVYVATAELKVDWAPYKYKFGDAAWTPGTNFGYKEQPGVITVGGDPLALNPKAVFEEVKVTPPEDGLYDFYLDTTGESPVTYVKKHQ